MPSRLARPASLALCGLASVRSLAPDPCECVKWSTAHLEGVPDGSGWELIQMWNVSMYRDLDANMCLLKTARCVDEEWDSNVNTPTDTWCYVSDHCPRKEGSVAGTRFGWKTCTDKDTDFCSLSPAELLAFNSKAIQTGDCDPTTFVAWACTYASSDTIDTIAAQTGLAHLEGCGFNSLNAPAVQSVHVSQVVDTDGCSLGRGSSSPGFTDVIDDPAEGQPRNSPNWTEMHVEGAHNVVVGERTGSLAQNIWGPTKLVPAGCSKRTVGSPDECAMPYSLYVIGHGQIYFCSQSGPENCTCETGCD